MDRDETLRRAEKLLRQGRLDAAIEEYARVVDEHPTDLASINALGDLYVRATRSDLALPLYLRVADAYFREGFHSKAAGFYKKVLKFRPDDEDALVRLGELSVIQGRRVDARAYFESVVRLREARGDAQGADELVVRLADVDPGDLDARVRGARALARSRGGVEAATTLRDLASELERHGRAAEGLALLREAVRLDAGDRETLERVVRASLEEGDVEYARAAVSRIPEPVTPGLLAVRAELELADGRREQAREAIEAWLACTPEASAAVIALVRRWAERDPEGAYACLEVAVDRAVQAGRFEEAAATLEEYVGSKPRALTALRRLVEICEQGRLVERLGRARAALADEDLARDRGADARAIVEERLAHDSDEVGDLARPAPAAEGLATQAAALTPDDWTQALSAVEWLDEQETSTPPSSLTADASSDAGGGLEQGVEPPAPAEPGPGLSDLDVLFDGIPEDEPWERAEQATPPASQPPETTPWPDEVGSGPAGTSGTADELGALFARWRDQSGAPGQQPAAQLLSVGKTYVAAGLFDQARPLLEAAARDPECRVRAARLLARLHAREGRLTTAILWLERAVESPGLDDAQRLAVLRELGAHLESTGEFARSLAVWLEAQSLVPADAEVEGHIARLSRLATPGGEPFTP